MSASAKFLHGISDDPQLERQMEKQIGCMAGFLQLFDRHHILTGKRLYGPKRLGAPRPCSNKNNPKFDDVAASANNVTSEDYQRPPVQLSGHSNAASRTSSMDCNGTLCQSILSAEQVENVSTVRPGFQSKASENSSGDNKDVKAAHVSNNSRAPNLSRDQPRFSLDQSRHSLDIRDVVRETFYRDSPKPLMDTRDLNRKETHKYSVKYNSLMDGKGFTTTAKDPISSSPKSLPKFNEQVQESLELAAKSAMDSDLKKITGNFADTQEPKKSSFEPKEGLHFPYDSREMPRASVFEYKDALRSSFKLREAPRLSLDSRAHLGEGLYGRDVRNDKQGIDVNGHNYDESNPRSEELSDEKKRSPSVVARLMGLEAMPNSNSILQKKAVLRRSVSESRVNYDILRSQRTEGKGGFLFKSSMEATNNYDHKAVENATSRQNFSYPKQKDSTALALSKTTKDHQSRSQFEEDRGMKAERLERMLQFPEGKGSVVGSPHLRQKAEDPRPINIHRYPIEPAPWKQRENSHGHQQSAFGAWNFSPERKRNSPQGSCDLYREIENRLKQRGLEGSGKDFETLKQIVEAVQLKSLLYSEKDRQMKHYQSSFLHQKGVNDLNYTPRMRIFNEANVSQQEERFARPFEAPIVLMKPAKLLSTLKSPRTASAFPNQHEKVGNDSSQIGYKGNNNRPSRQRNNSKGREPSDNSNSGIAPTPRTRREHITNEALQRDSNSRRARASVSPQVVARTPQSPHALSSTKGSNSPSPSKQRTTKSEVERKARHAASPIREKDTNRGSPAMQSPKSARSNSGKKIGLDREHSSCNKMKIKGTSAVEIDETEQNSNLDNTLADEVSLLSDGNRNITSHMEMEKQSSSKSRDCENSDAETTCNGAKDLEKCNKSLGPTDFSEQPSPVSVLDSSFYKEDCSPPPVMKRSITFTEEETGRRDDYDMSSNTGQCQLDDLKLEEPLPVASKKNNSDTGLQQPEMGSNRLVPELDSLHKDKSNPIFSYIAEILLASGLLEDSEAYPIVFNSSVSPIDPQLFFVLEHRQSNQERWRGQKNKKTHIEQINRELIFDTVNDILCGILSPYLLRIRPWISPSSTEFQRRRHTGRELLKQVWDEFQGLPCVQSQDICETLNRILQKDLAGKMDLWDDHTTELSGIVLDIERMIFKDLIDETIRDMGVVNSKCPLSTPKRKLHFH